MLELVTFSLLNGLVYGLLLFMLSSGLTLIFSMMGVLNFAHASMFMLGAYFSYQLGRWVGFWPALVLAPLLCGLVGAAIERYGLRRVHRGGHVAEILFTFGLAYVIEELVMMVWGRNAVANPVPAVIDFSLFTRLRHAVPGLQGPDDGDLGGHVRVPLPDADAHAHRPGHPRRADASADGRRARPRRAARLRAGVRGGQRARGPRRGHRRLRAADPADMANAVGPIVFVVVVVGGLGSLPAPSSPRC